MLDVFGIRLISQLALLFLTWGSCQAEPFTVYVKNYQDKTHSTCHSVWFPTSNVHPPFRLPQSNPTTNIWQQKILATVPEESLVQMVLGQGSRIGIAAQQQDRLTTLFAEAYEQVKADDSLRQIESVLPHCLSPRSVTKGHYFLYLPARVGQETEVITFLHGFGGNFLFYLKVLKDLFPDHIIVLPSWGATWGNGNGRFLREVYDNIFDRFSLRIQQSHLIAISGAGANSFHLYHANHQWFRELIVLASMPQQASIPRLRPELNVLMINGRLDSRFPISTVRDRFADLKRRLPQAKLVELEADHFFFLSQRDLWHESVLKNTKI